VARRRAHVLVSGRVQGVFFRATAAREARARGVVGWVRNLDDGRVEAVFEGEEEGVRAMVDWCRHGPRGAVVEELEVVWEEPRGDLSTFSVR
jgi:acylphosphatase